MKLTDEQIARLDMAFLHVVTEYDRKQQSKPGYNPYALGHYAGALSNVKEYLKNGESVRYALGKSFCGPLLDKLLKVAGETPSTRTEKMGLFARGE